MPRRNSASALLLALAAATLAALAACGKRNAPAPATEAASPSVADDATVALLDHARGLMGQFEFEAAAKKYEEALRLPSPAPEARLGRAIATLNQSREGAQDEALAMLGEFIASAPSRELELRARYCQGLCLLYLGRAADAVAAFGPVAEARSTDPYALYFMGQSLEQVGEHTKAIGWYEKSSERDPLLKSAVLGIQRCARRLGDTARAEAALTSFERLAENPRARNAEFKYTRMGSLGLAVVPESASRTPYEPPVGPLFDEPKELAIRWPEGFAPKWSGDLEQFAVTVDLDGDGRLDILVARALEQADGKGGIASRTLVLLASADGSYDAKPDHPLVALIGDGVYSILCGDIDADGRVDLYVCRRGDNALLLADGNGGFRDVTEAARVKGRGVFCVDGALADLDQDGDLDLFLCFRDGPNQLYINNGDGTFREIGSKAGVATEDRQPIGVIVGDFDYDRDPDIFVLNELAPHECLLNERLWSWKEGKVPGLGEEQLNEVALAAAVVERADIPLRRFVLATPQSLVLPTAREEFAANPSIRLAVGDISGDGYPDLVAIGQRRVDIRDSGGRAVTSFAQPSGALRTQLVTLDALRGPELLTMRVQGVPLVWRAGSGRGPFAAVSFSGRTDPSQSMRSNTSGIGTSFAARVGGEWTGGSTFRSSTGGGQSLAPVSIGLGPFPRIDVLEIEWSDGVFQSEMDLAAGKLHELSETQRQISSCPVLFAWNGTELGFVTDVLGVGGLGYLLEPGVYSEPRPRETLVLPEGALVPRVDGTLSLTLAEPMEESCMLDAVRLAAVDLPPGWDLAPDERLGIGGAAPSGALVAWRTAWMPKERDGSAATDLAEPDLVARDVGPLDQRFIGLLAGEQLVELEFGTEIAAIAEPWLVIDGWVEYPYCQTMFASWQAGVKYRAPSLEARGADGAWRELVAEWGYPAGMPRRMALPIPKDLLPAGATALRMRTNMEVYFDSVRLVSREPLPAAPVELGLARASLASVGFARRTTGPQKQPHYDRARRLPLWDCRFQRGLYTEFGDVKELLLGEDGALVVFGPGEEVAFDFAVPAQSQREGWTRRYVLDTRGWCKDMDLLTRDGETIAPLPVDPKDARAKELMARTRTRAAGGR